MATDPFTNINIANGGIMTDSWDITTGSTTAGSYVISSAADTVFNTGQYSFPSIANGLEVHGDAAFDGDIKVQGRSITDFMDSVEQRLNILRPNSALETEWDQLRELGQRYRKLEAELNEKAAMWAALGKTTPPVDK